ncbi:MAG: class I SAM-dependent methyltransferase [Gammaproteobacteria bacterium]|nr:class I SAM-dependent methyltransferase [Gammaproteobacteria bacterium]
MGQSAFFWDKIAERYSKKPVADEAAYQKKLQVTRQYLRPDTQIFEFGCGTGSTAIVHAPRVKHIHAIDISKKMIEIAKGKANAEQFENVTFEQGTIEAFSSPDSTYDVVLGLSILHLLEDKESAIDKVYRMLRPGGVFVTSTVCMGDTMKFFKFIAPIGNFLRLIPFVEVFSVKELEENMTTAGFTIEYQWQPGKGKAVFMVSKKPGGEV